MMIISLNGEPRELPEQSTIADLVMELDLVGKRFAIEVNEDVIPKSEHASHRLSEGDKLEIVRAVGGG